MLLETEKFSNKVKWKEYCAELLREKLREEEELREEEDVSWYKSEKRATRSSRRCILVKTSTENSKQSNNIQRKKNKNWERSR